MKEILDFFSRIRENNNREWFDENRTVYQLIRSKFAGLVSELITEIQSFDSSVGPVQASDCIFRINRDIRFSKDKTPYKTNIGAFIARGGRKTVFPGYYIHLEPGGSFAAGGMYMPAPPELKKIRQEIYFNASEFRALLEAKNFKKLFDGLSADAVLKRPPREYAGFADADLLLYKSFTVSRPLPDAVVTASGFKEHLAETFRTMKPLNDFLNRALDS